MSTQSQAELRAMLLEKLDSFSPQELLVLHRILDRKHIARNPRKEYEEQMTFGQRLADKVAAFGGSWRFIMLFAAVLLAWVILNSFILARRSAAFDPYPYILLNLFLSMTAAMQAPVIMMSQQRLAVKDRLDAAHDYEINLKAELEIAALHEKMDDLREKQWKDLVQMQQEQIRLLTQIAEGKGKAEKA